MEKLVKSKGRNKIGVNVDNDLFEWIGQKAESVGLQPGVWIRVALSTMKNDEIEKAKANDQ